MCIRWRSNAPHRHSTPAHEHMVCVSPRALDSKICQYELVVRKSWRVSRAHACATTRLIRSNAAATVRLHGQVYPRTPHASCRWAHLCTRYTPTFVTISSSVNLGACRPLHGIILHRNVCMTSHAVHAGRLCACMCMFGTFIRWQAQRRTAGLHEVCQLTPTPSISSAQHP
jgi:hypothetical protein